MKRFSTVSRVGYILLPIAICLIFPLGEAEAAKGVVVANPSGCDFYVVETKSGYDLLEWFGGNDPNVGETMVGDFEGYGMKTIYNATVDSEASVWVEDYFLSKNSVIEKIREHCH